ncbi:MAG: hypothetical protein AAB628_01645 [Patescibacteria group bacterium]
MVFSFLFSEKQDDTLALLIDIGSASVGTAIVSLEGKKSILKTNKVPHVFATNRETIPFQETLSSAPFLSAMNHALERSLKNIQKKTRSRRPPAHIYCTLSSPWFISKTRHIQISRETSFKVDEKILNDFLDEDIENLKKELNGTLTVKDIAVIEKKIIQMKLNGYEIKNPLGKTTPQIEIISNVSLSSDRTIESIERAIGHFFHTKSMHFCSFPLAAYSTVRDIFPEKKNFLFIDITGEATDISLISNDLLIGTTSFAQGKNFFIRAISSEFKTPHEEAATLFGMFLSNALDAKTEEAVATVVNKGHTEWSTQLEKSLITLAKETQIPNAVYFTCDSDVATLFLGLIDNLKSESLANNNFEAKYIDHFAVASSVTFNPSVVRDPFLVIEALFAFKLNQQK